MRKIIITFFFSTQTQLIYACFRDMLRPWRQFSSALIRVKIISHIYAIINHLPFDDDEKFIQTKICKQLFFCDTRTTAMAELYMFKSHFVAFDIKKK